jgi:hypothetical protein
MGVNKMERVIEESNLDKKSLKMLGEYEIDINWIGVWVMFNSKSLCLNETETKALIEFGKDNSHCLVIVNINVCENSYRAGAFYMDGDYEDLELA